MMGPDATLIVIFRNGFLRLLFTISDSTKNAKTIWTAGGIAVTILAKGCQWIASEQKSGFLSPI
jgi:hypothetical protein